MGNKYQDKAGHFTSKENDDGECLHNSHINMSIEDLKKITQKEYRQNMPYEELTSTSKKGIIQLSKSEYAIVRKRIFEMQVQAKRNNKNLPRTLFVSTANNCYLVSIVGGDFYVLNSFDIERDWERLKEVRKKYE